MVKWCKKKDNLFVLFNYFNLFFNYFNLFLFFNYFNDFLRKAVNTSWGIYADAADAGGAIPELKGFPFPRTFLHPDSTENESSKNGQFK
jgi:hypothetical protein